ncbi:MAG: hypothetical protein O7H39_10740 [Gammaproteobacteria bacterium]|nr:hypothetical protein [Gammaproteobacteria bacterium]
MFHLARYYAVEIDGYAIMANHFHLAVYFDPTVAQTWSADEVAQRWVDAYPPKADETGFVDEAHKVTARIALLANPDLLEARRQALGSLSHFMKNLKQPIARRANIEDGCTGHFFEGRFYSGALLNPSALLACLAYIDLNPIRAGIAMSLSDCELTSIVERIKRATREPALTQQRLQPLASGIENLRSQPSRFDITLSGYTKILVEAIAAIQRTNPIGMQSDTGRSVWSEQIAALGRRQKAYGTGEQLQAWAKAAKQHWIWGTPLPG